MADRYYNGYILCIDKHGWMIENVLMKPEPRIQNRYTMAMDGLLRFNVVWLWLVIV